MVNFLQKLNYVATLNKKTPCEIANDIQFLRSGSKSFKDFKNDYPEFYDGTVSKLSKSKKGSIIGAIRRGYAEAKRSKNSKERALGRQIDNCYKNPPPPQPPLPPPPSDNDYPRLRNWIIDYEPRPRDLNKLIDNFSSFDINTQNSLTDLAKWIRKYKYEYENRYGSVSDYY